MQALDPTGVYPDAEVLDTLTGRRGARTMTYRYDRLDSAGKYVGPLDTVLDGKVANNMLADIKRTATFTMRDTGELNFLSDRVQPWARLAMPAKASHTPTGPVLTNLVTNPAFSAAGALVTVRTNLTPNPSFEGGTYANWGPQRCTASVQTTFGHVGPNHVLMTVNAVGYFPRMVSSAIAAAAGDVFTASAYKNDGTGSLGRIAVQFLNGVGAALTTVEGTTSTISLTRLSVTATAPANTASVAVWLGVPDGSSIGVQCGWDGVLVEKSPVLGTYFDGSTPATVDYAHAWTGTPNASTSTLSALAVAGTTVASAQVINYRLADVGARGGYFWRSLIKTPTAFGMNLNIPIPPAGVYTVLTRLRSSRASSLDVRVGNAKVTIATATDWNDYRVLVTSEGIGATGFVRVSGTDWALDDTIDVAYHTIVAGDYTGSPFDGASPSATVAPGSVFAWTGAPNASTSTATELVTIPDARRGYVEWPLGVFLLATPERVLGADGVVRREVAAYDLLLALAQDSVTDRYSVAQGAAYTSALATLAAGFPYSITPSALTLPTALEWAPGTPKLRIINDLLAAIGYESASFDELGTLICRPYLSPAVRAPGYRYAANEASVISGAVNQAVDLFDIPNRFVLVKSEADTAPLVSTYTNTRPDSPTSTVSRGRTITAVYDGQDAPNQATLDAKAARYAFESSQVFEVVKFATMAMPMHGNNEVVGLAIGGLAVDATYSEHSWELPLKAGAVMTHTVRRVVNV